MAGLGVEGRAAAAEIEERQSVANDAVFRGTLEDHQVLNCTYWYGSFVSVGMDVAERSVCVCVSFSTVKAKAFVGSRALLY